jgi:hypothetical protein
MKKPDLRPREESMKTGMITFLVALAVVGGGVAMLSLLLAVLAVIFQWQSRQEFLTLASTLVSGPTIAAVLGAVTAHAFGGGISALLTAKTAKLNQP